MKKTIFTVLAISLTALILAGCASKGTLKPYESPLPEGTSASSDPYAGNFGGSMEEFTAEDLQGNAVTQEIFSDYDLTMVEIWATWCPGCLAAMPEVQTLYSKLPENVNLITICSDASKSTEKATKIMEQDKAEFITLKDSESLKSSVIDHIMAFPSFIFVDSTGKVVGDVQMGAPGRLGEIADAFLKIIDSKLELLGKSEE